MDFGLRQLSDAFGKYVLVEAHDLRNVCYRILGQTGVTGRQSNVSRSRGPFQVACQRDADDRRNSAAIQRIALHNDDRPTEAWARTELTHVGPPSFALGDHQSLRCNVLRPAARANESEVEPISSQALFIASVTSSGEWMATYSRSASAKSRLRDLPVRFAKRSARSYTSSGSDTAVFIPKV